jgi:CheY-like chemotaxis protein
MALRCDFPSPAPGSVPELSPPGGPAWLRPAAAAAAAAAGWSPAPAARDAVALAGPAADIVAVEDSDDDFEALARAVHRTRPELRLLQCRRAADALAGLRALVRAARSPRLVLLDLNLPGIGGRALLAVLRADPVLAGLRIVVVTTSSNPADLKSCRAAGADGYVVKSVDFTTFQESIRSVLDRWSAPAP